MADTIVEEDPGPGPGPGQGGDTVAKPSMLANRENLDRLIKIFHGGTGVNLGTRIVKAVEMQTKYGSVPQSPETIRLADIIRASLQAFYYRSRPDTRRGWEEAKAPVRVAQYGRSGVEIADQKDRKTAANNAAAEQSNDVDDRRVTLDDKRDKRQPPKATPHMTQRVKTFYMDPYLTLATKRDDIIIPRTKSARALALIGGTPITKETAIELRQVCLGTTIHSFCMEWRKSSLTFHDIQTNFSYGLRTKMCGSRALVLCVQGYLLKHLLFAREYASIASIDSALHPTEFERRRALCGAVCEMLWTAGSRSRCCLCLPQDEVLFENDYKYRVDGITEKLQLYEFKKFQDLEMFVKRQINHFESENSNGCILLLYSIILSRTVARVYEDMCETSTEEGENVVVKEKLLTDNENCSQALINLLLTGRAVPHFHNGNIMYDKDGALLPNPLKGVRERTQVGLLHWDRTENEDGRTEIGSMHKTPRSPIWLSIVNGQYGLLFSTNPELVCEWRAEHHFTLYYYTGMSKHVVTPLTVETLRVPREASNPQPDHHLLNTRYQRRMRVKTGMMRRHQQEKIPSLERCILTKWYGATIDWNGVFPYV